MSKVILKVINKKKDSVDNIDTIQFSLSDQINEVFLDTVNRTIRVKNGQVLFGLDGKASVKKAIEKYNSVSDKAKEILNSNYNILIKYDFEHYLNVWNLFKTDTIQQKLLEKIGVAKYSNNWDAFSFTFYSYHKFNVMGLDDNLKKEYPDDYKSFMSMKDFISNKFGEETMLLIKKYI